MKINCEKCGIEIERTCHNKKYCFKCYKNIQKEYKELWMIKNHNKLRERSRDYYLRYKEEIKEKSNNYRLNNQDLIKERKRIYYEKNKILINLNKRQDRKDNHEKYKEQQITFRIKHPERKKEFDHKYYIKNKYKILPHNQNYYYQNIETIKNSQKIYRRNHFIPKIKNEETESLRRNKISKTLSDKYKEGKLTPKYGMLGRNQSEETKKLKREKALGRKHTEEVKLRLSEIKKGKKPSEESIRKMTLYWNSEAGRKFAKERRAKQIFPMRDSNIEVKIQNFLKELGIEFFTHQYMKEIEHGYQCDILIPSMNLVIECDGDYWHKYPIGKEIDHIRTKELLEKGFKVLRLWEMDINEMTIDIFKHKLDNLK